MLLNLPGETASLGLIIILLFGTINPKMCPGNFESISKCSQALSKKYVFEGNFIFFPTKPGSFLKVTITSVQHYHTQKNTIPNPFPKQILALTLSPS